MSKKLFFIDPMSYGTIASYDENLLKGITANNDNNLLITYFHSYLFPQKLPRDIKGNNVFRYNKLNNSLLKLLSYGSSLLKIIKHVLMEKPDLIHIQWIRVPLLDLAMLRFYKLFGGVVFYTAHNVLPHNDNSNKTHRYYKRYYKNVDYIIVHSDNTKQELILKFDLPEEKIMVIPHGILPVTCNRAEIQNEKNRLKETLGIKNQMILSCLGVQSKYKGTDILIDAWKSSDILCKSNRVLLIIAGKAKNIDYEKLNEVDNVRIINEYISDEEYLALLQLSDFTILPYKEISQSGSLLTAINEYTPVLVSHVGGLYQPLEIAKIGWDFGFPNSENLSETIQTLISKEDEVESIKNAAEEWEKIHKYYSWNRIGKMTVEAYKSVINKE